MKIVTHPIEPWLMQFKEARFDLASSGVANQTLQELLQFPDATFQPILDLSLSDSDTRGSIRLRQAIASLYKKVDPDSVLVTTGTSEALLLYFIARQSVGSNIVVPTPAFQNLEKVPEYIGYEVRRLSLERKDNYRINLQELSTLVDDETEAIVINNPNNPTGMLYNWEEINTIAGLAANHRAEILADEHYRFIPYGESNIIPSIYDCADNVVATGSMIKCFGCVGLRVGWLIGPKDLLEVCRDIKDYTTHTVSPINEYISAVVLENWEMHATRHKKVVIDNLAVCRRYFDSLRNYVNWIEPQAGIVCFPWFVDPNNNATDFAQSLFDISSVSVLPGESFGFPHHFRLGLGQKPRDFQSAMELLYQFIITHKGRSAIEAASCDLTPEKVSSGYERLPLN